MSEWSAEFELSIDRHWELRFMHYETSEMSFNSEMDKLYDFVDMPYSLSLDEYDEFRNLTDGEYRVYVRGEAEYEPDMDWESGIDEGCFELSMDKISISRLEDLEKPNESKI
jgi:hypothetical protein